MQSDAITPEDYIASLEDDWRRATLLELRSLIMAQAPQLTEQMHYKMLGYGDGEAFLFHLNAQRHYVSLYVGNVTRIDPDGVLVKGLNVGKGCIRFSESKKVSETRIDDLIARALVLWQQGEALDC